MTLTDTRKEVPLLIAESEIPGLHDEIGTDGSKDWDDYPLLRFIQDPTGQSKSSKRLRRRPFVVVPNGLRA